MIKVLNKTFDILEYVSKNGESSLSAIAKAIGEKPTTVSNITATLLSRGYLEKSGRNYKLGILCYALTENTSCYDTAICELAESKMKELAAETQTTAVLSVLRNDKRYAIMRLEGSGMMRVSAAAFDVKNPCLTETGLLLLAYLDDDSIGRIIDVNGVPEFFADKNAVLEYLAKARQNGYVTSAQKELYACAAPIFDNGKAIAAIGVFTSIYRVSDKGDGGILEKLLATANAVSAFTRHLHISTNKK